MLDYPQYLYIKVYNCYFKQPGKICNQPQCSIENNGQIVELYSF